MRSVVIVGLLLTIMWLQPSASADGCRIDLSDPSNPAVYGDCIGVWHDLQPDSTTVVVGAGIHTEVGFDDPTGTVCTKQHACRVRINEDVRAEIDPKEPGSEPAVALEGSVTFEEDESPSPCLVKPYSDIGLVVIDGCLPAAP